MKSRELGRVSAAGADTTWNTFSGSAPLVSRIAGQLQQRGLSPSAAEIETGYGLSTYPFTYRADLTATDDRAWSDDFLRSMVSAAIQAATTYDASVSIEKRITIGETDAYEFGGGVIPEGDSIGGQSPQAKPSSMKIPILSDLIDGVSGIVSTAGTTGQIAIAAIGLLVVGGVVLVLWKPETIRKVI